MAPIDAFVTPLFVIGQRLNMALRCSRDAVEMLWDSCRYLWDGCGYLDILSGAIDGAPPRTQDYGGGYV